ncbi:hypothetical protein TrRE_jg215, partial [Triparma retinervis]
MGNVPQMTSYMSDVHITIDTVQEGNVLGGNFRLQFGGDTTGDIAHDALPVEVQSQLESLSTVDTIKVTRSDAVAYQDKKERDEKEGLETRMKEVAAVLVDNETRGRRKEESAEAEREKLNATINKLREKIRREKDEVKKRIEDLKAKLEAETDKVKKLSLGNKELAVRVKALEKESG